MPDPTTTPTDGQDQTTGRTGPFPMGLISRLLRTDQPESTKRAVALLASCTLCAVEMVLTLATYYQAVVYEKVDGQLVFALLGVAASVAALAGVAYRKPEADGGAQ
jgi:hypothetical protein